MSPDLAARRVRRTYGATLPIMCERRRSAIVHVTDWRLQPSYDTTATTVRRPLCGQRGRRWWSAHPSSRRRLCGRCATAVARMTPLYRLADYDVATELRLARTVAEVEALRPAVIDAHPLTIVDGVRLHSHYATALTRVERKPR